MPLKVTSNSSGLWITWTTPDEGMSATFRIRTSMDDEEILKQLMKATTFISSQMGMLQTEIDLLEAEIRGSAPTAATATKTPGASPVRTVESAPATAPDPNAPRIPMMSPASLSDAPAGGAPVETFGWSSYPTTTVPGHLADPKNGGWEMIPEGER